MMSWETVSTREALLLLLAAVGMFVHVRSLLASLADRQALREQGLNGARRLLVRGHIRGHALRIVANGVVIGMALWLMTRPSQPTDRTAPIIIGGLLVITGALLVDGVLDARDWRKLEEE